MSAGLGLPVKRGGVLDVETQVQRLVLAATSHENLAVSYGGWCAAW